MDSHPLRSEQVLKGPGSSHETPGRLEKVLGEMLGESLSQVEGSSQVVSSSPIWTLTERTPSPCKALPKKSSEVPFSSEDGTFQRLGGPGSFHKAPGCPENVLVEVLMEMMVVLVENMCVGGTLKTFS